MKDHYGVGRIEQGETEWWGNGAVWRSAPGCILLKQPGDVVRHLSHRGPTTFVAVQLPAHEVASARPEGEARVIPQLLAGDERAAPFHRLLDAVVAQTDSLALEVALAEALSALVASAGAGPDYTRPVRRALEYPRVAFAEPITLETLASHAELDKFHLCRAFRAQVGMPPHAYLTHLRIARAKQLLEGGGARASELAPLVGLYDQAQLTRHFRRLVGTTPAHYARSPRDPSTAACSFVSACAAGAGVADDARIEPQRAAPSPARAHPGLSSSGLDGWRGVCGHRPQNAEKKTPLQVECLTRPGPRQYGPADDGGAGA